MRNTVKRIEIYEFVYKGIVIPVHIDYVQNIISLMDKDTVNYKKWIFANRGGEYMGGWLDILEGMKMAIKDARARCEAELAEINSYKNIGKFAGADVIVKLPKKHGKQ